MKVTAGINDLATVNPALAAQWHPAKNERITTNQISPGSNFEVWWLCAHGHEWQAAPVSRVPSRDKGCPMCSETILQKQTGNPLIERKEFVSLLTSHPKIASEWHPTKNGNLSVRRMTQKHSTVVWWLCSEGHRWKMAINIRIHDKNNECSQCLNRKRLAEFLVMINPRFVHESHPTKNDKLPPYQFPINAISWLCSEGHEWTATINSRIKGKTCPICSGERTISGVTDLLTVKPSLSLEWHPTKNGSRKPENVSIKSKIKASWICSEGHEWKTSPVALLLNEGLSGCPICSNKASLTKEWHPTRNDGITIEDIVPLSMTRHWWLCSEGHEWHCHFGKRILVGNTLEECPTCSSLSTIHSEWHPNKNDKQTPEDTILEPRTKFWWLCSEGHEWKASVHERTRGGSFGRCPFCSNHKKVIMGVNDFETTHPTVAEEWHPTKNGILTPNYITVGLNYKYWWLSSVCGHEWEAFISNRIKGSSCSVCRGRAAYRTPTLTGQTLSTVNPILATEWHPTKNGKLVPNIILAGSSKKVWWICSEDHEWEATVHSRNRGSGCPSCWASIYISKAETEIYDFVSALDENMEVQKSNRSILRGKELDIYIPDKRIAIEFNGLYWHTEKVGKKGKKYHYNKWAACKKLGIQLIQVWEDEWNLRPEHIKNIIARELGFDKQRTVNSELTKIKLTTKNVAEEFLYKNHVQGFVSGSYYLGLVEEIENSDNLLSLLVLDKTDDDKSLTIIRYATSINVTYGFDKLLLYAINEYTPDSVIAYSDNSGVDGGLYKSAGFSEGRKILPEFMYYYRNKRYPKSEYSMDRFRTDPALEWVEGFNEDELAEINDIDRIWDAGKTVYRL